MRKNKVGAQQSDFSILTVDDDETMTLTLQSYFKAAGFRVDMENDPVKAVERVRENHYDILLLDFLMRPICGDEVVRRIREFNPDIFIVLLTGHKSMAPPVKTIRELDIQGYYEKSERFDQLELLVESCVKSIRQMRTIRSYRDGLSSILENVPLLCRNKNFLDFITDMVAQMKTIVSCPDAFVYFRNGPDSESYFYGIGNYESQDDIATGVYEQISELENIGSLTIQDNAIAAPLLAENNELLGIIALKFPVPPTDEVSHIFAVYAKQVGAVSGSLILRFKLEQQNEELKQTYAVMRQNYMETIDAMRLMVEAKDFYTRGHSDRVSFFSCRIAETMGMDKDSCERIRIAGLFHDIGKVSVPDSVLLKASNLTEEEFAAVRSHPSYGRKVLSAVSSFRDILDIVESHHERIDGAGYPNGLSGSRIPVAARIITVADAFDAMTSKRSYRDNFSVHEAIAELMRGKNTQFDSEAVDIFCGLLKDFEELNRQMKISCPDAVTLEGEIS